MTTGTLHPLAADYVDRLRHAGRRLPRTERRDLLLEIEAHLSEAIDPDMSDAQALTVLDRLGAPEEIVAAQQPAPVGKSDARASTNGQRSSCCCSAGSSSVPVGSLA